MGIKDNYEQKIEKCLFNIDDKYLKEGERKKLQIVKVQKIEYFPNEDLNYKIL